MQKMTVDERLENAASYGEMQMYLFLWEKTITRLTKNGLTVEKQYASKRKGEYYCLISWEDAKPEQTQDMNQANNLYVIAKEA